MGSDFVKGGIYRLKLDMIKRSNIKMAYSYRLEILKRDGGCCVDCSSVKYLHVHHLDFSGKSENPNNDPSNLITLCASCHGKRHVPVVVRQKIEERLAYLK